MPLPPKTRDETWSEAAVEAWDMVVVGGGITGAGVAREAARSGLSVLLLEQKDFAWGASGRSSKMIHGGLRYLKERQIKLTREAVREREHLLRDGRGLVEPLRFLYLVYKGDRPGAWTLEFGLTIYDLLKRSRRSYHSQDAADISLLAPNLNLDGLRGGFIYTDAQTDDARLTFRVLREAGHAGARILNYVRVEEVAQNSRKDRCVLAIKNVQTGETAEIKSRFVVNATGAWSGGLGTPGGALRLRPLRGSHLILPWEKLPATHAVTFAHPEDGRPVFAYPWEGVTLVGTTDLDHGEPLYKEPAITPKETNYLLDALQARFEDYNLSPYDLLGTFAGVRPVVFGGLDNPSQEPRELVIHEDGNLVTVAGGKLTTFHSIARKVVQALCMHPTNPSKSLEAVPEEAVQVREVLAGLSHLRRDRILGRLGPDVAGFLEWSRKEDLREIPGTPYTWAELKWAFEKESVAHLDDLLLRRVRLGHLLPGGGLQLRDEIQSRLSPHAGWQPRRWEEEWDRYEKLWNSSYSPAPEIYEEQ